MKIVKVEAFPIQAEPIDSRGYWGSRAWGTERAAGQAELSTEFPVPLRRKFVYSRTIDTVIVRIETDSGHVGWGEAKAPGRSASDREDHRPAAQRYSDRRRSARRTGVVGTDVCRHARSRPPRRLLYRSDRRRRHRTVGPGRSGRRRAHLHVARRQDARKRARLCLRHSFAPLEAPDEAIAELVEEARSLRAAGYTGVKMAIGRGVRGDLRAIRAIRDGLGDDFTVYADAAGVYSRADAMRLGEAMEELGVGFFEMPIPPEDVEGYAELAQRLSIPIALDSIMTRHETVELIRNRAIDIVQPDVCRAGGITECRRIAELADCFGLAFQPHVSIGSAVHVAASAHLAVAMPNSIVCEYWIGKNPIGASIAATPAEVKNGYLFAPSGAGLGIGLNAEQLLRHAAK